VQPGIVPDLTAATELPRNPMLWAVSTVVGADIAADSAFSIFRRCVRSADPERFRIGINAGDDDETRDEDVGATSRVKNDSLLLVPAERAADGESGAFSE
jgi:hypothetical protein